MCTSPMMIPTYRYNSISSSSSPMPLDLNEDHHNYHHFFNITNQPSSSSSISYSTLFNQDQDQLGSSSYSQPITTPTTNQEVGNKFISWDHEEVEKDGSISEVKKVKDLNGNFEGEDISVKCMPLKMRIKRRMMVDQMDCEKNKFEKEKQLPLSPLGNTSSISSNNSSSNNNSNITVRVCTDCHTTKTPLWRSGPTGPKSLCNACGIRQRKARRALAATAAAESGNDSRIVVKDNKLQSKGKKRSKTESAQAPKLKKKHKHGSKGTLSRNNFSFDDLIISLSENLGCQQVFPQDEKEAAILLMALSHGFPQIVT